MRPAPGLFVPWAHGTRQTVDAGSGSLFAATTISVLVFVPLGSCEIVPRESQSSVPSKVGTGRPFTVASVGRLPAVLCCTEPPWPDLSFQRATDVQEKLVYDEPEPLPFAAHHWLGAALIESKRFDDAEKVYRADLKDHPHNGWSLLGLQQALEGKGSASTEIATDFAASWSRSDTWIRSSRF